MSIFNKEMLLQENYLTPATNNIEVASLTNSYTEEALDYIREMNKDLANCKTHLYKSILEAAGNDEIINESFDGFVDKVKEIIDKFLDFIKRIIAKFNTAFHKLIKSDKYLIKNKNEFSKFGPEQNFKMDIFKYTLLDSDQFPNLHALKTIQDISGEFINTNADALTGEQLVVAITNAYSNVKSGLEDWYGMFRASVLNEEGSFDASDFEKELYRKFRNGEDSKSNEEINSTYVNDAYNRFAAYDKTYSHINKCKADMEKEYNNIKKDLKALNGSYDVAGSISNKVFASHISDPNFKQAYEANKGKIEPQVKLIIDAKVNQVSTMCNIHALAFTAKLDATKEAYKQDKKLLYAALKRVNSIKESAIPEYIETMEGGLE